MVKGIVCSLDCSKVSVYDTVKVCGPGGKVGSTSSGKVPGKKVSAHVIALSQICYMQHTSNLQEKNGSLSYRHCTINGGLLASQSKTVGGPMAPHSSTEIRYKKQYNNKKKVYILAKSS